MRKLLTLITLCITVSVGAQVLPSPDAAAMIKGINSPVNLYNGTVSVSIPLYEASANNGAKVPVALTYNGGGGIRVAEVAGVAGLGWNLQAGGAITRVMRSEPDDQAKYATNLNYKNVKEYLDNDKSYDFEKDLFYFSYPGGNGRFVFSGDIFGEAHAYSDSYNDCIANCNTINCFADCADLMELAYQSTPNWYSESIITLPSSDLNIKFYYNGKLNSYFVITDNFGTKYYFGQTSSSREVTTTNVKDNKDNKEYKDENERKFISTWKLNRIEYANQPPSEDIRFTYVSSTITDEQENTVVPLVEKNFYYQCMKNCTSDSDCNECEVFNNFTGSEPNNPNVGYCHYVDCSGMLPGAIATAFHHIFKNVTSTFKSTITTKYLTAIRFPKGRIDLLYNDYRNDLSNGKSLKRVNLVDHKGRLVSSTELYTTYFSSYNSYFKGGKNTSCYTEKCKRLKLESIIKDGALLYEFDYSNGKHDPSASFDPFELPPRDSYYTDHWGYYNGGTHQGELYVWHPKNGNVAGMEKYATNAAKANILTKITFPTGGYRTFSYQKHDIHGGIRIDRIRDFDSDGVKVSDVNYDYFNENTSPEVSYVEDAIIKKKQDGNEYRGDPYPHLFSNSKTFTFDLNGPTNGYGRVEEINELTNAKTVHYFKDLDDRPQVYATKTLYGIDTEHKSAGYDHSVTFDIYAFPYVTNTLEFFDRGVEKMTIAYDESGKKIKEVENFYRHEEGFDFSITNRSLHMRNWDQDVNWLGKQTSMLYKYIVSEYQIKSRNVFLDRSVSREYDDNELLIAEYTTSYEYSGSYQSLPVKVTTEKTAGAGPAYNSFRKTYYPFSITSAHSWYSGNRDLLTDLKNIHAIATPVAELQEVDLPDDGKSWLTSGMSYTTFQDVNNMILPRERHSLMLDRPKDLNINTQGVFEKTSEVIYNDQGLVASKIGHDGIITAYTYDEAGYVDTVMVDPGVESMKRMTTYTYYPLIGLKSVTSPNGRKVTYTYDDRNRLLMTKDDEGNILKRYRYNYAGEHNSLNAYLSVSDGYNRTCSVLNFTVTGANDSYGKSKYTWNFGDAGNSETCGGKLDLEGEPIEGGITPSETTSGNSSSFESFSNHATHVFTEPGDYTVTVRVFNPEVGKEKVLTRQISIYDLYANAKINGTDKVEYCTSSGGGTGFEDAYATGGVEQQEIATLDGDGGSGDYPNTYFRVGFENQGARCQDSGYSYGALFYRDHNTGSWKSFGENGVGSLPEDAFYYSSSPYNIDIKGEISDNCSNFNKTAYHTLTVNPCNYGSGGTGGGGTGGGGTGGGDGGPILPDDPDGDTTVELTDGN